MTGIRIVGENREWLKQRITSLYVEDELAIRDIAELLKLAYSTVRVLLSEAGVNCRERSIATIKGLQKAKVRKLEDEERPTPHDVYFECEDCGYLRMVTGLADQNRKLIWSPFYGTVTVKRLAELDALNHDCKAHLEALERARIRRGQVLVAKVA